MLKKKKSPYAFPANSAVFLAQEKRAKRAAHAAITSVNAPELFRQQQFPY